MTVLCFRLLLVSLVLLLGLTPVTSVSAAKPFVETFHNEGSFEIDCGSFTAVEDFVEDVRVMVFFDKAGDPVRVEVHINYTGVITNPETGRTLRDPGHFKIVENLEEGTVTYVGLVYGITVPGEGVAVLDTGRVIFDGDAVEENIIFEAGPHQYLHGGDAVICAALD